MFRTAKLKTLAATGLGVVALAIAPAAFATTTSATDTQLAVTASLYCSSCAPGLQDQATANDVVTAGGSVTNLTLSRLKTLVDVTLSLQNAATGTTVYSTTKHLNLAAGQMYADSASFVVQSSTPAGVYTLMISANGVSTAASITIY